MKKAVITLTLITLAIFSVSGCAKSRSAAGESPVPEPTVTADVQPVPSETAEPQAVPAEVPAPAAEPVRQDGDRFESVIILEGMEEPVHYEHIRSESVGIEMDYDYESFVRLSEPGRERFVSVWDTPETVENYLELIYSPENADTVAAFVREKLSAEYDLSEATRRLEHVGDCIWIEASVIKGTNNMADHIQTVYIIPAPDGCRIATVHSFITESEGFGHRFSYMLDTLSLIDTGGKRTLSDDQALSAIRNYCISSNPDLENIANSGEYLSYWELASGDDQQVVVLFRSYTGALVRYYIDRSTGNTYVTEFVPGITPEEVRTEESLNVWDYLS